MNRRTESPTLRRLGVAILVLLSIIAIATRLRPGPGLLVLLLGMVILGASAAVWGYDSRDGRDW
jgi:cyanate permease